MGSSILVDYDSSEFCSNLEPIDPRYIGEIEWRSQVDRLIICETKILEI